MDIIKNTKIEKLVKFSSGMRKIAHKSGWSDSSIWLKNATLEQIDDLLNRSFSRYVMSYDIGSHLEGVEKRINRIKKSNWSELFEKEIDSFYDLRHYVIFDLVYEYHKGLREGVRNKIGYFEKELHDYLVCETPDSDYDYEEEN